MMIWPQARVWSCAISAILLAAKAFPQLRSWRSCTGASCSGTAHAERLRGATLVGPHRDDINILINGDAARDFASQGQQRTLALSLKLSELELAYAEKGEYPVLLLDDALSELDDQRGRRILELPAKTQTFISAATLPSAINQGTKWLVQAIDGVAHLQ